MDTTKKFQTYSKMNLTNPEGSTPDIYFSGLAAEVGEVMTEFQRVQWKRHPEMRVDELKSELGDVLWYLYMIADHYGLSLEDVMRSNMEKRHERHGAPRPFPEVELTYPDRVNDGSVMVTPCAPETLNKTVEVEI